MKILLVCPYFPPEAEIAALRIAEFAKHWARAGHEVQVLTRHPLSNGTSIPVHAALDIVRVRDPLMKFSRDHSKSQPTVAVERTWLQRTKAAVIRLGRPLIFPDIFVLWAVNARMRARRSITRPDIVVTSGGPLSGMKLGATLARSFGVPLAVDFRDPVATNPMNPRSRPRIAIETAIERRIVKRAAIACTVSPTLAAQLEQVHSRPMLVVMNGFDADTMPAPRPDTDAAVLTIVYTGRIYANRTEYLPFFQAVARLASRHRIEIHYYGRSSAEFVSMAKEAGAEGLVIDHGEVEHQVAIEAQACADVLLLLLWNDPRASGVVGGKLAEYIGARRPILMLGYQAGDAARIVRDGEFGCASNSVEEISQYLEKLMEQKSALGAIPPTPAEAAAPYTRERQSGVLLAELRRCASANE